MKRILSIILVLCTVFTFAFSIGASAQITSEDNVMTRAIPEGAVLYKEGLYVYETSFVWNGNTYYSWDLYSADGWCFYDLQQPENYVDGDIEGELLPPEQRVYAQYATMPKDEYYVTNYIIPVPVEDGYEIVSVGGNDHETA